MPVDIESSPLFVVSNTYWNRIQEQDTDIVPEQYTLTDSLDNDRPPFGYTARYPRFGARGPHGRAWNYLLFPRG